MCWVLQRQRPASVRLPRAERAGPGRARGWRCGSSAILWPPLVLGHRDEQGSIRERRPISRARDSSRRGRVPHALQLASHAARCGGAGGFRALLGRIKLGLLSNTNAIHARLCREQFADPRTASMPVDHVLAKRAWPSRTRPLCSGSRWRGSEPSPAADRLLRRSPRVTCEAARRAGKWRGELFTTAAAFDRSWQRCFDLAIAVQSQPVAAAGCRGSGAMRCLLVVAVLPSDRVLRSPIARRTAEEETVPLLPRASIPSFSIRRAALRLRRQVRGMSAGAGRPAPPWPHVSSRHHVATAASSSGATATTSRATGVRDLARRRCRQLAAPAARAATAPARRASARRGSTGEETVGALIGEEHLDPRLPPSANTYVRRLIWTRSTAGPLDIRAAVLDGTEPLTLASVPASAGVAPSLAVADGFLYWTTGSALQADGGGAVYRMSSHRSGGAAHAIGRQPGRGLETCSC